MQRFQCYCQGHKTREGAGFFLTMQDTQCNFSVQDLILFVDTIKKQIEDFEQGSGAKSSEQAGRIVKADIGGDVKQSYILDEHLNALQREDTQHRTSLDRMENFDNFIRLSRQPENLHQQTPLLPSQSSVMTHNFAVEYEPSENQSSPLQNKAQNQQLRQQPQTIEANTVEVQSLQDEEEEEAQVEAVKWVRTCEVFIDKIFIIMLDDSDNSCIPVLKFNFQLLPSIKCDIEGSLVRLFGDFQFQLDYYNTNVGIMEPIIEK